MENKINIAELLKDCPKGMELDCTMFDKVTFVRVDNSRKQFPIEIAVGGRHTKYLTKEGCFHDSSLLPETKCVIFPKDKTTWEGFQRPFKEGDVVISYFGDIHLLRTEDSSYCAYRHMRDNEFNSLITTNIFVVRFATEREKQKLFQAIKDNGYRWDEETKTLVKLVEPRFKVNDWCIDGEDDDIYQIVKVLDNTYTYRTTEGEEYSCTHYSLEDTVRLWTIQDAKEDDVLAINWNEGDDSWEKIIIFKKYHNKGVEGLIDSPCVEGYGNTFKNGKLVLHEEVPYYSKTWTASLHPATEEEKQKLFDAIKANGYKWNPETKTLEKLVELNFKVNNWCIEDKIRLLDCLINDLKFYASSIEKQDNQKNKINSYKITFEDVLALECAMKTVKITKDSNELYEMLVHLYNKIHNVYLVERQGKQNPVEGPK